MKLWKGLTQLEPMLKTYAKRFLETCTTLHHENGWLISGLYQQEIYRMAIAAHKRQSLPLEDDLVCITIEHMSYTQGEGVYFKIIREIQHNNIIHNMKEN